MGVEQSPARRQNQGNEYEKRRFGFVKAHFLPGEG
jgi:hypothetical protein